MPKFPMQFTALKVHQPLGMFYVAIIPAQVLLEVAYSDTLSAAAREDGIGYSLSGTQRLPQPKRLQPIADFINRSDAAFPNSIILAANFRQDDGTIEDDDDEEDSFDRSNIPPSSSSSRVWYVEKRADGSAVLNIPTAAKLAAIIDGQHRLFAFAHAHSERLEMELICSIFIDLPKPFQARLFATINSNQKPVDKSLTYELFGYNLEPEAEAYWSPDKLAVYFSRRLGTDTESPLFGKIVIAPKRDQVLQKLGLGSNWKVSTAVVVEGIMRLITTNPKKDSANLLDLVPKKRSEISSYRKDKAPLRELYLAMEDVVLYTMIQNYLEACRIVFWSHAAPDSFITKTVGLQALFDILRMKCRAAYESRNISSAFFVDLFGASGTIDFSSDEFQNASGSGRTAIRKKIEENLVT